MVMPPTRHHRWEFVKGVPFCVRSRHGGAARLLTGQGIEHSATRPAASMQYDINPHDTWKESPAGKRREKGASILIIIHRLEKRRPPVLDIMCSNVRAEMAASSPKWCWVRERRDTTGSDLVQPRDM